MSKRILRPAWMTAIALGLALLMGGCGQATIHEPGVYKGSRDPDATAEAAAAREQKLRERARLAFTDR